MKKRLSVWLSCVLVMVLVVSFSVPVSASSFSDQWTTYRSGTSGTVNLSMSNSHYFKIISSDQYLVDANGSYKTGQIRKYFWSLTWLANTMSPPCRARVVRLSVSSGTTSGGLGAGEFVIGSVAQIQEDRALSVPYGSGGTYTFDAGDDFVSLWFSAYVFTFADQTPSYSASMVTYSFDSVQTNYYGTDYSINKSIDALNSNTATQIQNQTNSINNKITEQTQQQTNTLTKGYDSSGMNADNDRLSSSLDSYDHAEVQVTDQSNAYIDAVTFFDPTTHLQLMACMTYVATFLQDLFVALGDWSVLVMLALSLAFALMLIGWFKYRK